jgi:hypothetical protein
LRARDDPVLPLRQSRNRAIEATRGTFPAHIAGKVPRDGIRPPWAGASPYLPCLPPSRLGSACAERGSGLGPAYASTARLPPRRFAW